MDNNKNTGRGETNIEGRDDEVTRKSAPEPLAEKTALLEDLPTVITEYEAGKTISSDETSPEKTIVAFNRDDIKKKIADDMADIPEVGPEELEQDYLSSLIKSPLPNRTNEEQMRINRNFLRDAEPFQVERLMEEVKRTTEELSTGFASLDRWLRIPLHKLTLIASRPGHGKTSFMLNMILNMSRIYKTKHFLYYSYNEPRQDIEIKLINMSGEKPFAPMAGISNNFERWKYEFQISDVETLKNKAETDAEFIGLKHFLEVSHRIHVIDANYNIVDLFDSIEAFSRTLSIGCVFIDFLQGIRPGKDQLNLPRRQQLQDITHQLRELCNDTSFPLILGVQPGLEDANTPEYDGLAVARLKDTGDPELVASLIIGLQNYAKSLFIGSNINNHFKSRFYNHSFEKAETMPGVFRDKHPNTVLLVKVLANQGHSEPEVEMLFNKWLMRISDIKDEA
jgi:hypothetical protein